MNSALQDYIDKYISMPNYDINSEVASQHTFQEGGMARFFPIVPNTGGYRPIQAPSGTPPEQGQHELWNSVANNGMNLGRLMLQKQSLNEQKKQNVIDNQLGYARLELAKQELAQRDAQFKISTIFEKAKMVSSVTDSLAGLEIPTYAMEGDDGYKALLAKNGIPQALEGLQSNDLDVVAASEAKIRGFMASPEIIKWSMEKKANDAMLKNLQTMAEADPLLMDYSNAGDIVGGVLSGQKPPAFQYRDLNGKIDDGTAYHAAKVDQAKYNNELRTFTTKTMEVKNQLLELDKIKGGLDIKEAELEFSILDKALKEAEGDPDKQLDIIHGFKMKLAAKDKQVKNDPVNDTMIERQMYYASLGDDPETARRKAHEDEALKHKSSIAYSGLVTDAGQPVSNKLATSIIDAANNQVDNWGPIQSADRGTVNSVVKTGNYRFRGGTAGDNNPLPAFGSPLGITLDQGDEFYTTHTRINSDGRTVSVKGVVKTKNKDTARKLGFTGDPDSKGWFTINNVVTEGPKSDFGLGNTQTGGPTKIPAGTSSSSQYKVQRDATAGYYIVTKPDGSKGRINQATYDKQVAAGVLPKVN